MKVFVFIFDVGYGPEEFYPETVFAESLEQAKEILIKKELEAIKDQDWIPDHLEYCNDKIEDYNWIIEIDPQSQSYIDHN